MVDILAYIPFGRENAISRTMLSAKMGISDRKMRELISKARKKAIIINLSNGRGYYQPTEKDVTDVVRFKKQEESRARDIYKNMKPVRKFLSRKETVGL